MASLGLWKDSLRVRTCRLVPFTNQRVNAAPGGGSEQAVDMLNDRWLLDVSFGPRRHVNAAALEAFDNSFRGQV